MAKAEKLAQMDATRAHESEGAASVTVWARREIQQDAGLTRALVRSVSMTRTLHQVRKAAVEGRIGMRHLQSFAYAIAHCGAGQVFARETEMVAAATSSTPRTSMSASGTCGSGCCPTTSTRPTSTAWQSGISNSPRLSAAGT